MKTFLIIVFLLMVFNACSTKNAYSSLKITPFQEKSEENTLSSKIQYKDTIDGLVTAIYLNALEPETYDGEEYFYVYLYTKTNNDDIKFLLNDKEATKVEELKAENIFSHLSKFKTDWSQYYLVSFIKEDENLSFQVQNDKFSSDKLLFQRAEK